MRERPVDEVDGVLTEEDIIPIYAFVVDFEHARPLAQLLQVEYGGDAAELPRFFSADTWLTFPTWRMQLITGTEDEWRIVASWWAASRKKRASRDSASAAACSAPDSTKA